MPATLSNSGAAASTKSSVVGAAPEGATDKQSASRAVREMFTTIAPRYDLLNHVLSFNIDRLWWARAARTFDAILKKSRRESPRSLLRYRRHDIRSAAPFPTRPISTDQSRNHRCRLLAHHAPARRPQRTSHAPPLGGSRCPKPASTERALRPCNVSVRVSQPRRLRRRTARNCSSPPSRRRMRHPRLRRTKRLDGNDVQNLFQEGFTKNRHLDLRGQRPVRISSCLGGTFP